MADPAPLLCTRCNAPYVRMDDDIYATLVGYGNGPCGQPHDDNCLKRAVWCANGHRETIALRRTCAACGWQGAERCGCHVHAKLTAWPKIGYAYEDGDWDEEDGDGDWDEEDEDGEDAGTS